LFPRSSKSASTISSFTPVAHPGSPIPTSFGPLRIDLVAYRPRHFANLRDEIALQPIR
jgi:hypothetical protein